jgi:hypothetical protein
VLIVLKVYIIKVGLCFIGHLESQYPCGFAQKKGGAVRAIGLIHREARANKEKEKRKEQTHIETLLYIYIYLKRIYIQDEIAEPLMKSTAYAVLNRFSVL